MSSPPNFATQRQQQIYGSKRIIDAAETTQIMNNKYQQRDRVKQKIINDQSDFRTKKFLNRQRKTAEWQAKTQRSPFLVDLLAENERIDEENKVRLEEQARRQKIFERRRDEAKNGIILRALEEASDLDALRQEKRIIMTEERRLKALLDIEKTKAHRKEDRMAAARAERQRKAARSEFKRSANKDMLDDHTRRENHLLKVKHEVGDSPDNSFSNFMA
ncbi:hypothetical protein ScalyP_jg244 [Parmales sp. scaly parma]|nr:hypothetical protein ScalyP_jg244 [Parmales sp. scaly parma]|tara:strand:+ start:122 stop:775 length:654 start_codon:yes stop_codon:yes gene_type:complete